jgi:hypothetical protein
METLKNAMADQRAPWSTKIIAAIAVLDRGWGKPQQIVSANVSVFDQMTDGTIAAMKSTIGLLSRPSTIPLMVP